MKTTLVLLALSYLAVAAPQGDGLTVKPGACECPLVYCVQAEPMRCECQRNAALECIEKNNGNPRCPQPPTCEASPTRPTPSDPPGVTPIPLPEPIPDSCGGRGGPTCPDKFECVQKPGSPCGPESDCPGVCVRKRQYCGGLLGIQCDEGELCINDPWGPECGMGCDVPGICVSGSSKMCGGFAGFKCAGPEQVCVDDPRDDCDPKNGGFDCGGLCVG
ncbi:hypothetical protein P152DRAFT_459900 [Eremomyces bilateralis CBS 781.70]|uniref:Uncharacterized protein n=1 Tax=Eremomyces bilateralis CBS 781.70 TaxID=1392243 RepID=A0A6G1FZ24_9PEZI|nr:uncharacterized protein P152DRAFT_459900 [Eremomyces bilateralis CBS 781.70]KAF1811028.1 hypothetical protein P152DRAFT_459900 [Eremomyces bilateralis CBS 781.70]